MSLSSWSSIRERYLTNRFFGYFALFFLVWYPISLLLYTVYMQNPHTLTLVVPRAFTPTWTLLVAYLYFRKASSNTWADRFFVAIVWHVMIFILALILVRPMYGLGLEAILNPDVIIGNWINIVAVLVAGMVAHSPKQTTDAESVEGESDDTIIDDDPNLLDGMQEDAEFALQGSGRTRRVKKVISNVILGPYTVKDNVVSIIGFVFASTVAGLLYSVINSWNSDIGNLFIVFFIMPWFFYTGMNSVKKGAFAININVWRIVFLLFLIPVYVLDSFLSSMLAWHNKYVIFVLFFIFFAGFLLHKMHDFLSSHE